MKDPSQLAKTLQELIDEKGTNATQLAKDAGLGQRSVANILDGSSQSPRENTLRAIAAALGVSATRLLTGAEDARVQVPIVGIASAGDGWTPVDTDYDEAADFVLGAADMMAIEVRGDSMHPVYRNGDLLICRREPAKNIANQVGKDCVVQTIKNEHFVKKLTRSPTSPRGFYTLLSYNTATEPIYDVALAWAAPILWVKRRG
jgi:phage repressor protein C with HTH and peptisase S24 domain